MPSRVHRWLSLGLIVLQTIKAVRLFGSNFNILNKMENIRFDGWIISSLSTWSPLDCSRKCETNITCLSFQYSPLSGQCRLFNTVFIHQESGVQDIGWQYYIASNRRCRDSFIDARSLDICFIFAGFYNIAEGREKCTATQSSIISIRSAEENEFLIRLSETLLNVSLPSANYRRPYIQGFWNGVDWISDNGSPLLYTNWDKGEPSKVHTRKHIKLQNGKWNAVLSSKTRQVFCSYIL